MKPITHLDIDVYLTLAGTYRAYVKDFKAQGCDAWGSFRDTAIRKLIQNLSDREIPFDFGDAPDSFWRKNG